MVVFEGISRTEAAEGYHRVGGLILSRLFVGSLGAGTGPPINLDGNGGPEPQALFASSRAAIKGLLPGASVCCPTFIGDQAYSLVLDCREAIIPPTFRELGEGVADVTDQALHHGQYGCLKMQVNQMCRGEPSTTIDKYRRRGRFDKAQLVQKLGDIYPIHQTVDRLTRNWECEKPDPMPAYALHPNAMSCLPHLPNW